MKIMLGTPITGIVEELVSDPESLDKTLLDKMLVHLRAEGHEVFCALEIEKYGVELMPGDLCTPRDFEAMKNCDAYVAFPNSSYGCAVELGWASALKKPIFLAINQKIGIKTPLYQGMTLIDKAEIINYSSESQFPNGDYEIVMQNLNRFMQAV
jgi:nucleoside 2-deoxyribosyltransferase